jgi:hypothetical protein
VGFGGKVGYGVDGFGLEQIVNEGPIGNVALDKPKSGPILEVGQGIEIARVGEGVEDDHPIGRVPIAPVMNKVGTNKPGPTGDQDAAGGGVRSGLRVRHCQKFKKSIYNSHFVDD